MKKELAIQLNGKLLKTTGRPKINLKASPTKEIIEEVLFWISSGETLRSYCRQKNKPCYATFYSWMNIFVKWSNVNYFNFSEHSNVCYETINP